MAGSAHVLALLMASLLSPAEPASPGPVRFAVDWAGVPDAVLERCRLAGLETLLIQKLLDAGYAAVAEPGPGVIAVRIRASKQVLRVETELDGARRARRLRLGGSCDSTLQLELSQLVLELVELVIQDASREPAPQPEPEGGPKPAGGDPPVARVDPVEAGEPAARAGIDTVRQGGGGRSLGAFVFFLFPGSLPPAAGLGGRWRAASAGRLQLHVKAESAFALSERLLIAEPALGTELSFQLPPAPSLSIGVEALALAHLFRSPERSGGHLDARLGVPLTVAAPSLPLGLALVPHGRLVQVRHVRGGRTVYSSAHWGILLRVWFGA